jgi:hypothetical protein
MTGFSVVVNGARQCKTAPGRPAGRVDHRGYRRQRRQHRARRGKASSPLITAALRSQARGVKIKSDERRSGGGAMSEGRDFPSKAEMRALIDNAPPANCAGSLGRTSICIYHSIRLYFHYFRS